MKAGSSPPGKQMVSRIAICSTRLRTKSSANPSTSPGWICERIRYLHRRSLNFYRERGLPLSSLSFFFFPLASGVVKLSRDASATGRIPNFSLLKEENTPICNTVKKKKKKQSIHRKNQDILKMMVKFFTEIRNCPNWNY